MQPVSMKENEKIQQENKSFSGKATINGKTVIYDRKNNRIWIMTAQGFVARPVPGSIVDALAEVAKEKAI